MASGRIRRSARRGLAGAVLAWSGSPPRRCSCAPSAAAAPTATVEIKNVTPPAASVDKGGTVTFVNKIPAQNKGGISVPLSAASPPRSTPTWPSPSSGRSGLSRPVSRRPGPFKDPATTGSIAYTYRIVPQAGLTATVANQVVDTVAGRCRSCPPPCRTSSRRIAPDLPALPSVNLPQLPQVQLPPPPVNPPTDPTQPAPSRPRSRSRRRHRPPPRRARPAPCTSTTPTAAPGLTPTAPRRRVRFDPSRFPTVGSRGGAAGACLRRRRRCAGWLRRRQRAGLRRAGRPGDAGAGRGRVADAGAAASTAALPLPLAPSRRLAPAAVHRRCASATPR